ncbi:hypothetical protein AVEN_257910-1 [Araneus ventricosus]|uniref:Uncharacterized protein n=1 Tax=Araneus ventricosus TaxID=182803 RepID=A0A4Y2N4H3_ARAVE|nr:hypothetical protein AVEN_257910-1 [Araneus ventricosus]
MSSAAKTFSGTGISYFKSFEPQRRRISGLTPQFDQRPHSPTKRTSHFDIRAVSNGTPKLPPCLLCSMSIFIRTAYWKEKAAALFAEIWKRTTLIAIKREGNRSVSVLPLPEPTKRPFEFVPECFQSLLLQFLSAVAGKSFQLRN